MASCGCSSVTFFGACEKGFYFDVEGDNSDADGDAFCISCPYLQCVIQSKNNKFLVLNEEEFQGQYLPRKERDCKFNIQIYKEDSRISKAVGKGRPVMLYADKDGKKMVACCSDRQEIYPEAMDLPNKINETAHKALFYLTGISGSTAMYTFESSLYTGKFLGFKPVEDNPSLDKLVLLESKPDEVDEAICFRW